MTFDMNLMYASENIWGHMQLRRRWELPIINIAMAPVIFAASKFLEHVVPQEDPNVKRDYKRERQQKQEFFHEQGITLLQHQVAYSFVRGVDLHLLNTPDGEFSRDEYFETVNTACDSAFDYLKHHSLIEDWNFPYAINERFNANSQYTLRYMVEKRLDQGTPVNFLESRILEPVGKNIRAARIEPVQSPWADS